MSFSVPSGQICGLLGPNCAGKTTLFRLLMGILKATEGKLFVDGLDAFEDRVEVKRLIGFLPDEPAFYSYMSGSEVLQLSAAMHGLDVKQTMSRLEPLIENLRLTDEIHNYAEEFSRGMKKKLGLILALFSLGYLAILQHFPETADILEKSQAQFAENIQVRIAYAIIAIGVAPFAEENLFRGLLYRALDR